MRKISNILSKSETCELTEHTPKKKKEPKNQLDNTQLPRISVYAPYTLTRFIHLTHPLTNLSENVGIKPAVADQGDTTYQTTFFKKKRSKLLPESFEQDVCNLMKELLHKPIAFFLAWHAMSLQNPPF